MAPSAAFFPGGRLLPAQCEIFGFRTHKPVVNVSAIGDVKNARGENRPPLVRNPRSFQRRSALYLERNMKSLNGQSLRCKVENGSHRLRRYRFM